jgi:GR25 family glycosyltransferase involved in LPS biosynthesis
MNPSFGHYQITMMNDIGARRRTKFTVLWRELGLPPEFIHTDNIATQYPFFSDAFNRHMTGVAGCLNTHRKAWESFLHSKNDFALITEDDAIPSSKIRNVIDRAMLYVSHQSKTVITFADGSSNQFSRPSLIQLGWFQFPKLTLRRLVAAAYHYLRYRGPIQNGYVRGYSFTVHCYLINREMATLLLDKITSEGIPTDLQIMALSQYHIFQECLILRSCANYAVQERIDSSIDSEADWGVGIKDTVVSRLSAWVHSLADAKGNRISF